MDTIEHSTTTDLDREIIEHACRVHYGERWARMEQDAPRRWMRDTLGAIGVIGPAKRERATCPRGPHFQYTGKLYEIGEFGDRAPGVRVECDGRPGLEISGLAPQELRAIAPLWGEQVTITMACEKDAGHEGSTSTTHVLDTIPHVIDTELSDGSTSHAISWASHRGERVIIDCYDAAGASRLASALEQDASDFEISEN